MRNYKSRVGWLVRCGSVWISLFVSLLGTQIFAQTTGKIRGKVIDATTGEPLPYANIIIEGTVLGAAADLNGEYIIINVPVGTYVVEASMMGYTTMRVEDVRVSVDMTTTVNFRLEETAIRAEERVVKAKRPIIERDVTASSKRMSGKEITQMPVSNYEDVIKLQTGALETGGTRSGGLHIRGGRTDEIVFVVDGINTTDPVYGVSGAIVDENAIQEMLVISGGFDAEYGNAMSGVVNVVTKEGRSKYEGRLKYTTDGIFTKGDSLYNTMRIFDPKHYGSRFGLNDVALTLGGPLPWLKQATFFTSGGYESYDSYLPRNDSRETKGTAKLAWKLSNAIKATVSGNYAYKDYHQYSHSFSRGAWQYDTPRRERGNNQLNLKLTHQLNPKTFYDFTIGRFETYWKIRGQNGRDYNEFKAIGERFLPWVSVASDSLWYNPETKKWKEGWSEERAWMWYYENIRNLGKWNSALGKWEWNPDADPKDIEDALNERRYETRSYFVRTAPKDGDVVMDTLNDTLFIYYHDFDLEKYISDVGRFIRKEIDAEDMEPSGNLYLMRYNRDEWGRFNYYFMPIWHERKTTRYSADLKLTSQINKYNEVKIGGNVEYHKLHLTDIRFVNENPYLDHYDKDPITVAGYVSDKIEYEDMVLKLGLRGDYFDPRSDFYLRLDSLDAGMVAAEPKWQLSPRLGICYAVSDKSIMYANYGHFFQPLNFADIYQNLQADITTGWPTIGNPNLPPQKEIMYEGGFQYAFNPDMKAEITAYFKDVKTLLTTRQMTTIFRKKLASYMIYELQDFALVKGVDLIFTKRATNFLSGQVSYSFQSAKGTGSSADEAFYFYYYYGGTGNPPQREYPLEFDINHTIKTALNFYLPEGFGPAIGGVKPLADLNTNLQFLFHTGPPYTPTDEKGSILEIGSKRLPAVSNIDLRVDKRIKLGGLEFGLFAIVQNLLNTKNVINVYPYTGEPDKPGKPPAWDSTYYYTDYNANKRYYKERFGWDSPEEMYEANCDNWRRYYTNPANYSNPRIIQLGVELVF